MRRWTSSVIERAGAGIAMRQLSNRGAGAMMTEVVELEDRRAAVWTSATGRSPALEPVGRRRPILALAGRRAPVPAPPARPALDPGAEGRQVAPTDEFRSNAGSVSAARTSEDERSGT